MHSSNCYTGALQIKNCDGVMSHIPRFNKNIGPCIGNFKYGHTVLVVLID